MHDLEIHGRVYTDGRLKDAWVYIDHGTISKVSQERLEKAESEVALPSSQFLLPAATDLHVHLRDWAQADKETVETGTKSALAGGVTTVAEMPNTVPVLGTAETVERRVALLHERSFTDFAVHAGPPDSPADVEPLARAGAFALKLFPPELGMLPGILKAASRARLKIAVHAEDHAMVGGPEAPLAEGIAIRKILEQVGARSEVRFAHVSTADGASQILRSRPSHPRITSEVTPHHLFMSDQLAATRIGVMRKVNPSLRSASNSAKMRRLMRQGVFDFYATDHAPHTLEEKFQGSPGFPALELALPLFLTKTRNVALVSRLYCEAPAAYLGIRKGKIARGYSADLVVIGRRDSVVDPEKFVSKGRVTPFVGETLRFAVERVFKNGMTVYDAEGARFTKHAPVLITRGHLH